MLKNKENKLILIDGNSILSTCFFGNLPMVYKAAKTEEEKLKAQKYILQTPDGEFTNGVYTMMVKFEEILEKLNPKYIAIAWDVSRNTFRRKIDPNYKAQRKDTNSLLKPQFKMVKDIFKNIGVPCFEFENFEADDIIGTLAKKFQEELSVIIYTKDQDALQLIDERISVWLISSKSDELYEKRNIDRKNHNIINGVFSYNPLTLQEEYGLTPTQIIDFKAIDGDVSDNVKGIAGVGEKTSIPLIQEFDTLENIYDYLETTPEKEIKEFAKILGIKRLPLKSFKESKEEGFKSKVLVTIDTNISELQNISLSDLEINIDKDKKNKEYEKYKFKSLIK